MSFRRESDGLAQSLRSGAVQALWPAPPRDGSSGAGPASGCGHRADPAWRSSPCLLSIQSAALEVSRGQCSGLGASVVDTMQHREPVAKIIEQARAGLIEEGLLTGQELDTLGRHDAETIAVRRWKAQHPSWPELPPA